MLFTVLQGAGWDNRGYNGLNLLSQVVGRWWGPRDSWEESEELRVAVRVGQVDLKGTCNQSWQPEPRVGFPREGAAEHGGGPGTASAGMQCQC